MQHQIEEGYTKAMMQFVKLAAKWGAKPVKTTGKHLKFRDTLGNQISAPKTSSDWRALKNFKSELKNRGFVQQLPTSKVKAQKVSSTPEVTTPTKKTAEQQTTFKDFMDRIRPTLTDVKRPETTASRMGRGYRKAIRELPASEKFRMGDEIIRQLRREEYIDEALLPSLVKATARHLVKSKSLQKAVTNQPAKQLRFTKLFHGTTKTASDAISKGGWRGDVNVTRQMTGKGMVNAAPDSMVAKSYSFDRAARRNDLPFVRTFKVPKSVADKNMRTLRSGAGDYTGKGYRSTTLTPQQANKYDITQKVDTSGVLDTKLSLNQSQRQELQQRVRTALRNPRNRRVLNREVRQGNEDSLTNLYRQRNNPQNPNTLENELRGRYRGKGVGRKETTNEQLAPMKSTLLGPNLESLPHIDPRGIGKKLLSVMNQKKGMDSTGRTPYKVP